MEGKIDVTLISRGGNKKVRGTYRLIVESSSKKKENKWHKQLQRVSGNPNGSMSHRL